MSIGQMLGEEDLKEFYRALMQAEEKDDGHVEEGINLDSIYLSLPRYLLDSVEEVAGGGCGGTAESGLQDC